MHKLSTPLLLAGALLAATTTATAQVSLTTLPQTVSQNFDAPVGVSGSANFAWTDNSTIPGWFSEIPANGIESQFAGGISPTQRVYSFRYGSADVGAGSGRAFGSRSTSAGTFSFAFGITNNTGQTLTAADISFVSAIWRTPANSTTDTLNVGYAITTASPWTGLSYTSVSGLSTSYGQGASGGAINADPNASGLFYSKSATISGLTWAPGDTLYLRFLDGNQAAAWGIDNFQMNNFASAVPEPASFAALAGLATLGLTASRRRRRA